MNAFTILEEYNEVVDEFLYNIRGIEWGNRWIPLQYKMNKMR